MNQSAISVHLASTLSTRVNHSINNTLKQYKNGGFHKRVTWSKIYNHKSTVYRLLMSVVQKYIQENKLHQSSPASGYSPRPHMATPTRGDTPPPAVMAGLIK